MVSPASGIKANLMDMQVPLLALIYACSLFGLTWKKKDYFCTNVTWYYHYWCSGSEKKFWVSIDLTKIPTLSVTIEPYSYVLAGTILNLLADDLIPRREKMNPSFAKRQIDFFWVNIRAHLCSFDSRFCPKLVILRSSVSSTLSGSVAFWWISVYPKCFHLCGKQFVSHV